MSFFQTGLARLRATYVLPILASIGVVLLIGLSGHHSRVMAKSARDSVSEAVATTNVHWHLAGVAEAERKDTLARKEYLEVIQSAEKCEKPVRRWFIGASRVALARLSARAGDVDATTGEITAALEARFWNWDIIRLDPVLAKVVPHTWLDSTIAYWQAIKAQESLKWHKQHAIILAPEARPNSVHHPLIIALHGGTASYREFSEHWMSVADSLNAIIAVPAGSERFGCGLNSWGNDFDQADQIVMNLLDSLLGSGAHIDTKRIYLAGFSQGAQAALKIALMHPDRFRGAILLSGYIGDAVPEDLLTQAAHSGLKIYALSGELESASLVNSLRRVAKQATKDGMKFELRRATGDGHEVPADIASRMRAIIAWIDGSRSISLRD